MEKEKMYLVPKSDLESLIYGALTYNALEQGGVDNWGWYGESISDFISEWKEEKNIPENEEVYMEDLVEDQMKCFKEVKE